MVSTPDAPANTVIFHHPDAVDTSRAKLMGRHAAGEGFLKGYVRHSGVAAFYAETHTREHFDDFARRVGALDKTRRPCHRAVAGEIEGGDGPRTLLLPGPNLAPFAWRRRRDDQRSASIVGLTHTTASEGAMDAVAELLLAPVQPWDALICTSSAVRAMVERLLAGWAEYLARRTGGAPRIEAQLPVIPLGVDCDAFSDGAEARATRARLRRGLGIGDEDVAVLFLGRLSFHAKAHPMPMYLALEETARRTGKRLFLIQAGWFANAGIEREFREGAQAFCPSVRPIFLDGRDASVRAGVWFAADVFASFSDNIQETFGLTPIEAMAAGLPAVVSDWDGYRDTIRHGIEGFMVPTWMPPPGAGRDLALPHELALMAPDMRDQAYNLYCGHVSQATAVDIAAAADALSALAVDPGLRRKLGEAGRRRARENFDWRAVIGAYQALWNELAEIRAGAQEVAAVGPGASPTPLRDDPYVLFAHYPTRSIDATTLVALVPGADANRLAAVSKRSMNTFSATTQPDAGEFKAILAHLAKVGSVPAESLSDLVVPERRHRLLPGIGWLAKMGLVALSSAAAAVAEAPNSAARATDRAAVGAPPASEAEPEPEPELAAAPAPPEDEATALKRAADAARTNGDTATAQSYLERALALAPDDLAAQRALGEVLAAAGDLDGAVARFERALALDERDAALWCCLGRTLVLRGEYDRAIGCFRHAVDLSPEDPDAYFFLGVALRRVGSVFESVQCLRRSAERVPERPSYQYHLALALKSQGRRAEATEAVRRGLALAPGDVFLLAAQETLAADPAGRGRGARAKRDGRIAFFFSQPRFYSLMRPLFDRLLGHRAPLISGDVREVVEFDPDAVVACEPLPEALRGQVPAARHIYLQSGFTGGDGMAAQAVAADYACVFGELDRRRLLAAGLPSERIWVTGSVGMDGLFRGDAAVPTLPIPAGKRVVLFAPTFAPRLSAAPVLDTRAVELIRGMREDVFVIIKPHPVTCLHHPVWMGWWRAAVAVAPDAHLVEDPAADIAGYLRLADVLVTDCSSVMFQFLALDRPIVLISNPEAAGDPALAQSDLPEWRWRDMGEEISDPADLAGAVGRAIDGIDSAAARRADYRHRLFSDLSDGQAAARICAHIEALEA